MHAVGLAKITPKLLDDLAESIERTRQNLEEGNIFAHVEEDIRFHTLIAAAADNEELCRILANVHQKSFLCRSKTYRLSASTSPVSHGKIYSALREGDRALAQQAMRDHILFVRDSLLRSMAAKESTAASEEEIALLASAQSG